MLDRLIDLIFPPVCGICGKIDKNNLCTKCKKDIKPQSISEIEEVEDKYFEKHISIFRYEGEIRDKILEYKFNREIIYLQNFFKNYIK